MTVLSAPKGDVLGYFSNYRKGKSSTERSGITWKALSELERNVPELTCKQVNESHRKAC
ncbi:hypothetical protein ACPSLY_13810 [Vibrio parahaemolyticus]|uniref:hypothetical protein n=1 Tax=Vibrio parahaemolyticus TaxID=670 RepID=UPI00039AB32C|nr:hypothetical protein [Vibrio parahaemolyticus]EGQ7738274.1 hypothetical protein [Vibrio parahaemolyticus]EGQ7817924.1 hypothetical protein [Vibrio parahaemolyticus]EHZ2905607.1 hypothetical protein [Vibrio parahaemolyticus]EIF2691984.1 hypothetical protein [Vibrio parahaemolyticus]EII3096656.1 hypothetical protein [Vibrio parahaemolyticus]